MSDSADITGAPAPLILKDSKGVESEYSAVALSDRDYDELDRWVQSQVVAISRSSLSEELTEGEITVEQYEQEMAIATRAAIGVSLYEARGAEIVNTPPGVARIAWQMCKKRHPDLKPKHFQQYTRQIENFLEILRVFKQLNNSSADIEEKEGPEGNE